MRKETFKNLFVFMIFVLSCGLGVIVANMIIRSNEIFTNGILGLAALYLSYRTYLSPTKEIEGNISGNVLELPKDFKYLGFGFILAIILYSAGVQAIRMFLFTINLPFIK